MINTIPRALVIFGVFAISILAIKICSSDISQRLRTWIITIQVLILGCLCIVEGIIYTPAVSARVILESDSQAHLVLERSGVIPIDLALDTKGVGKTLSAISENITEINGVRYTFLYSGSIVDLQDLVFTALNLPDERKGWNFSRSCVYRVQLVDGKEKVSWYRSSPPSGFLNL